MSIIERGSKMNLGELELKVKTLEDKLRTLEDIDQIDKLQKTYAYYLDSGMWDDIIDLFSENTESIEVGPSGVYLGKKGVRRLFRGLFGATPRSAGGFARHMQIQGVIHPASGNKTAAGRWHCFIIQVLRIEGELRAIWQHGEYENEYIKENGKWMFKKLYFNIAFRTTFEDGWVKSPYVGTLSNYDTLDSLPETMQPDNPPTAFKPYPSGYFIPFHYKHPVTGKDSQPPIVI